MTARTVSGQTYNFGYDPKNHLTTVGGDAAVNFSYNGDGQRVVATEGITKTVFVGNYFEWKVNTSQATKYYYSGGTRVAMQRGGQGVKYLLGDHLNSTSVLVNADGSQESTQGYKAWGEVRFSEGELPTRYTYTGQYSHTAEFGLMYYNARWYDPYLNRWIQPDSVIPEAQEGVLAWDRYEYADSNPVKNNDPNGQAASCIICGWVPKINAYMGWGPDYIGIGYAEKYVDKNQATIVANLPNETGNGTHAVEVDSTIVAAGIAVQSQWYMPAIDDTPGSGGRGIAQVSDTQHRLC